MKIGNNKKYCCIKKSNGTRLLITIIKDTMTNHWSCSTGTVRTLMLRICSSVKHTVRKGKERNPFRFLMGDDEETLVGKHIRF